MVAETLNHANLTDAHSKLRTWKVCLRADNSPGGYVHEGSSLPTFQQAFEKMVKRADVTPEKVRDALVSQRVDIVLTAHPTEAQRRTILLRHKRIVELLEQCVLVPDPVCPFAWTM